MKTQPTHTPALIRQSSIGLRFDELFVTGICPDGLPGLSDSVNDAVTFTWDNATALIRREPRFSLVILPLFYVSQKGGAA